MRTDLADNTLRVLPGTWVLVALAACAAPASHSAARTPTGPSIIRAVASQPPVLPVTVPSAGGQPVTVKDTSRILAVSLSGSLAEIVFDLGQGSRVVGRDVGTTFPEAARLPLVTRAHDLTAEGVLAIDPTVVLTDTGIGPSEVLDQLRHAGIPVVRIPEATSIAGIAPRIHAVATALGVPQAGDRLADRTTSEVDAALGPRAKGSGPRIAMLYLRGQAGVYLMAGKGSGADSVIEAIGGRDVGTELGLVRFRPLTSEALIKADPDVLLLMTKGLESVGGVDGLLKVPGVAETTAGAERRIVTIDDSALLGFGPDTGAMLRQLAHEVYG